MTFRTLLLSLASVLVLGAGASAGVIADYRADFQGTTSKTGWSYQWNNGPIGTQSKYQRLVWSDSQGAYIADAKSYPAADQSSFVAAGSGVGASRSHTGSPDSVGFAAVFSIACYQVQPGQAGVGSITGSSITVPHGAPGWPSVEVQIYVNDTLKGTVPVTGTAGSFDMSLGTLAVGDRVYVAVGPGETNSYDSFQVSYQIATGP
jgi:hypothetical protein